MDYGARAAETTAAGHCVADSQRLSPIALARTAAGEVAVGATRAAGNDRAQRGWVDVESQRNPASERPFKGWASRVFSRAAIRPVAPPTRAPQRCANHPGLSILRWEAIQTGFVDEPRTAVEQADALVSQVVTRLTDVFRRERAALEGQWTKGDNNVSTEDLAFSPFFLSLTVQQRHAARRQDDPGPRSPAA